MNQRWKYVKELQNKQAVTDFETQHNVVFPDDLKEWILKNNGGRPYNSTIDTEKTKSRVFKSLLSFNPDDKETIFTVYDVLQKEDKSLLPFASDPSGNFFCIKNGKIVLWLHETGTIENVADSFSAMLKKLHS